MKDFKDAIPMVASAISQKDSKLLKNIIRELLVSFPHQRADIIDCFKRANERGASAKGEKELSQSGKDDVILHELLQNVAILGKYIFRK